MENTELVAAKERLESELAKLNAQIVANRPVDNDKLFDQFCPKPPQAYSAPVQEMELVPKGTHVHSNKGWDAYQRNLAIERKLRDTLYSDEVQEAITVSKIRDVVNYLRDNSLTADNVDCACEDCDSTCTGCIFNAIGVLNETLNKKPEVKK